MSLAKNGVKDDTVRSKGVKDSPCYFCNEMFEMGQLQVHLKQCGSILEQCPLRCGAWIQRKHKETHAQDCPQVDKRRSTAPTHARPPEPSPPPAPAPHTWAPRAQPLDDCLSYLEKEIADIKLVVSSEASQREVQAVEMETMRAKLGLAEERAQHTLAALASQRAEAARADDWGARFRHDLAGVQLALQELQSQQLSTAMRLESAVASLVHEQRERELLEQALTQHDSRIRAVHKLEEVIEYIQKSIEEERERNAESRLALEAEVAEARRCSQHLHQLEEVRAHLHAAAEQPAVDRVSVVEVSLAAARAELSELSARGELLARDLRALGRSYGKLRAALADGQARAGLGADLAGDNGHLIWRVDNFTARMKDAKDNDTVLTSPLFRTSQYGYHLKAELNLNGIGKWKGRHMTCTVRPLAGPYDPLLAWPCDLSVNVVLRDQPASSSTQAMDIVKTLQVRRKLSRRDYEVAELEAEKTRSTETLDKSVVQVKRQYIFIPHTSLDKFDYVRDDVMFLEFVVTK